MGGPRRSPAEAVASLSEAIDLIRATWDGGRRGGIFADGEQYRIRGAKRGPEPAHDVSIWLGVLGPRMLRLAGEKADGWLPSAERRPRSPRSARSAARSTTLTRTPLPTRTGTRTSTSVR
jgi:alkanesulfonate monooxygenase SsuD/methylene tetrahydromethanopterin reductase-like flavin-dependent oxidoreductase (luciferase family)